MKHKKLTFSKETLRLLSDDIKSVQGGLPPINLSYAACTTNDYYCKSDWPRCR